METDTILKVSSEKPTDNAEAAAGLSTYVFDLYTDGLPCRQYNAGATHITRQNQMTAQQTHRGKDDSSGRDGSPKKQGDSDSTIPASELRANYGPPRIAPPPPGGYPKRELKPGEEMPRANYYDDYLRSLKDKCPD